MISHHINPDLMIAYAAGTLDEAQTLALKSHIALCDHCKSELAKAHAMGASYFENIQPTPLNEGAINSLLERLDVLERRDAKAENHRAQPINTPQPSNMGGEIPNPVAHLVDGDLDSIKWKRIAPGAYRYDLLEGENKKSKLFFLKVEPKAKVPEHSHNGDETTLILRGAYTDKFGTFQRGDIACHDPSIEHEPIISSDGPCISLVAVDAPLKFKGIFSRMLQPLIGI